MKEMDRVFVIFIFLFSLLGLKSCGEDNEYSKKALAKAKEYISQKYNFELLDKDVYKYDVKRELSHPAIPITELTGRVTLYAHHDEIDFIIYVDVDSESIITDFDNYEVKAKTIENGFKDYFSNSLDIDKNNLKIFIKDESLLLHNKFSDVATFLKDNRKLNFSPQVMVITNEKLDKENVENAIEVFKDIGDDVKVAIFDVSDEKSLDEFDKRAQSESNDSMPTTLYEFEEYFGISSFYIDNYYDFGPHFLKAHELAKITVNVDSGTAKSLTSEFSADFSEVNISEAMREIIDNNMEDNDKIVDYSLYKISLYRDNKPAVCDYSIFVEQSDHKVRLIDIGTYDSGYVKDIEYYHYNRPSESGDWLWFSGNHTSANVMLLYLLVENST